MRTNPVKTKLLSGQPVFGAFGWEFLVPGLPQIVKAAGAEFLLLDMEHAGTSYETIKEQVALCRGIDVVPMVRVPTNQYHYISRALDLGAMGIMAPMVGSADEAEFVTELQAGSELAYDWLVTHYHAHVYNLVYGMLGDPADAADVTQEVFLKVFRGIRGFRAGSSLKTWLYRIAVREALNRKRWSWRHLRGQFSLDADPPGNGAALEIRDLGASPFDALAAREVQAVVRRALASMPATYRSAVILRDLEGLSYEEVAEVLELSVGTVKSRIVRGRHALRKILPELIRAGAVRTARRFAGRRHRSAEWTPSCAGEGGT